MNGTVPGRMMLANIFARDAEKLRAMARKRASLVFTPDSALMTMGMTAPRNTTATFDQMPMPNQMIDQRQQGDARHGIERVDKGRNNVGQAPRAAHHQP